MRPDTLPTEVEARRRPSIVWLVGLLLTGVAVYAAIAFGPGSNVERAISNARAVLAAERRLGLDLERGVQSSVIGHGPAGTVLAIFYAVAYWPFVIGSLALTYAFDRPAFRLVRNAMLLSGGVGLVTMVLFPEAPPRLLEHSADAVHQLAVLGSLAHPDGLFNPNAAMPSFHVCWMIVGACGLQRLTTRTVRWVPPAVMAIAVVTTANHYVLDVVAGAGLGAVAWCLATPMQRALHARRAAVTGSERRSTDHDVRPSWRARPEPRRADRVR